MLASTLLFSLSAFAAAVSASAIPQQQDGLVKRQNPATIPTFSFGPSGTAYLGGGSVASTATGTQQASETSTSSAVATSSQAATSSEAKPSASSTTAAGTGAATGTIPTYSFFPSSTVPVSPGATSNPDTGNGAGNKNGNGAGDKAGNGTTGGAGDGDQAGGQTDADELASLLQKLLDLLGN
ncbi:hypothetical protein E0Z10_g5674 [Xylaria hypoxylon]|uniref:Uncharacterized protein n=1 Tax=Xylaria hypoxylon TaxID=37992 RepID=A0A4Z0YVB0_9PEZI|nr:hypothetical protein E0Z10_g5674 [Xylaria hypoxylon]